MHLSHSQAFQISSFDLNPNGSARLTAIANYLQEMAYQHAKRLGWGFHDMEQKGMAWVLSKIHIRMKRLPGWNDRITIETWPRGIERLYALRDFRIKDEQDHPIGDATTHWLVVDLTTHRPIRITDELLTIETIDDSVFDADTSRIKFPGEVNLSFQKRVNYSDLDIVGHVNNVRYMEWCLDAIPLEVHLNSSSTEVEMNFMNEAMLGDEVIIGTISNETSSYFVSVVNKDSGKECVRAKLTFS